MNIHTNTLNGISARESRLLFLNKAQGADMLEQAENTGGKMEVTDPLKRLESNTEKLARTIGGIKVGLGEWMNNFFRSGTVLDKKIQQEILAAAEKHIQEESDLAVGALAGILQRGKRKLYLAMKARIAEQIRADLMTYLEKKKQESTDRMGRYNRLSNMLKNGKDPIRLASQRERDKLTSSLERVGKGFDAKIAGTSKATETLSPEWQHAEETEQMVRQQMLQLGIGNPTDFDTLFRENAWGDKRLLATLQKAPELARNPQLKAVLISSVKELSSGRMRYYRAAGRLVADPNIGNFKERLAFLDTNNILGRMLRLSIVGAAPENASVIHKEAGFLILKKGTDYLVLDTKTGEITYRDSSRAIRTSQLAENSFSLAA